MNKAALATEAVKAALTLRSSKGIGLADCVCPYDLAIALGIKVFFIGAPSMEGMYSPEPEPPTIILNSERPAGRRRYTCGHEIGHHVFNHGYKIDQLDESNSSNDSPDEFLAQRFSSALLMPKIAVDAAFSRRKLTAATASAEQVYIIAQELGVSYGALISNLEINLKSISTDRSKALRELSVASIRKSIVGLAANDVFVIDDGWLRPTVDMEVGDVLLASKGAKKTGEMISQSNGMFGAERSGVARLVLPSSKTLAIRVSKRSFAGLAKHRHLEDADDE